MCPDIRLSPHFFHLITTQVSSLDIGNYLLDELCTLDESRLRKFLERRSLSQAITRGFEAVYLVVIVPVADQTETTAEFAATVGKVAEYILSEFDYADESIDLLELSDNVLDDCSQPANDMVEKLNHIFSYPLGGECTQKMPMQQRHSHWVCF
jgi:hypothetical protein